MGTDVDARVMACLRFSADWKLIVLCIGSNWATVSERRHRDFHRRLVMLCTGVPELVFRVPSKSLVKRVPNCDSRGWRAALFCYCQANVVPPFADLHGVPAWHFCCLSWLVDKRPPDCHQEP